MMYLIIHETEIKECKTKNEVKEYIKQNIKYPMEIHKVTKTFSVDDFE